MKYGSMMSVPRCTNRCGSRMCSMLASEPVSRLSTQITRCPRASSSSHRCEPRKPAPPVTRHVGTAAGYPRPRGPRRAGARQASRRCVAAAVPERGVPGDADRRPLARSPPLARPRPLAVLIILDMATTERRAGGTDDGAERLTVAPVVGPDDPRRFTDSGVEIAELYTERDLPERLDLGEPGEFPYTRGIHPGMYRKQTWTMRQYAGYASANESNERYRYLLSKGSTGLSMAFDLPTQLGLDSDSPRSLGEVGRTGVAIDSIDDMRVAFDEIPLDQVSTSMTINAPASVLLLLYELVAEEQGVAADQLLGTTQNDILKEYIARGNFIY